MTSEKCWRVSVIILHSVVILSLPINAEAASENDPRAHTYRASHSSPFLSRSGGTYGYTRYGAIVSTSQLISLYAGAAFKFDPYEPAKLLVIADAGVNGGKLKVGIPDFYEHGGAMRTSNLCVSYLHTWNDLLGLTQKGRDYFGIEWEEQLTAFPVQFGAYVSMDTDDGDRRFLASLGIGFGL